MTAILEFAWRRSRSWLSRPTTGDVVPRSVLATGFVFETTRVPLVVAWRRTWPQPPVLTRRVNTLKTARRG
jgi:hypothetical protein